MGSGGSDGSFEERHRGKSEPCVKDGMRAWAASGGLRKQEALERQKSSSATSAV